MKKLLLTFALLLISSLGFGQFKQDAPRVPKNFTDTIECKFEGGHIIIPVKINGKVYKYIFDTGANIHWINSDISETIGFKVKNNGFNLKDYNGSVRKSTLITVESFEIGKMKFKNSRALIYDMKIKAWKCDSIDGLIGSDMMKGLILKIDRKNNRLIFTNNSNLFKNEGGVTQKMFIVNRRPYVQITPSENLSYGVLFDTGDPTYISVSNDYFEYSVKKDSTRKRHIVAQTKGVNNQGVHGFEMMSNKYLLRYDSLNFCGVSFKDVFTISTQQTNTLGSKVLTHGEVIVDYKNKKFTYIPYEKGKTSFTLDTNINGLSFSYNQGHFFAGLVWGKSNWYEQGVRSGFTLIEVNDRSLVGDYCSIRKWIYSEFAKDLVKLKVIDLQGKERIIEVKSKPNDWIRER